MRRSRRRRNGFDRGEDINPMNYVSNLSDIMLVLAVGIMLALVLHWNVQLENENQNQVDQSVEFTEDDLETQVDLPENIQKSGEVYYDPESGKYYIVNN